MTTQNQNSTPSISTQTQANVPTSGRPSGSPTSTFRASTAKKRQNGHSHAQTKGPTVATSNSQSRNAKRARWAKKSRPIAKPLTQRGPEKEYVCECHGEPARKPRAGQKDVIKDPESGKMKDKPKGLGHWRCSVSGKSAKVTPRKPAPKENPYIPAEYKTKVESLLKEVGNFGGLHIDPYPAKLQTPVIAAGTVVGTDPGRGSEMPTA